MAILQLAIILEGVGGAYRGCQECIATKPEMETMLLHEECPLRDEMSHTQQCRSLENLTGKEFAEASKISGVKFFSVHFMMFHTFRLLNASLKMLCMSCWKV